MSIYKVSSFNGINTITSAVSSSPEEATYVPSSSSSTSTSSTSSTSSSNVVSAFSNAVEDIINAILKIMCNIFTFIVNNSDIFVTVLGAGSVLGAVLKFSSKIPFMSSLRL